MTGTSYSFLAIAVNVVGDSPDSDTLANIVAGTPPGVPQNLRRAEGVPPQDTKITLGWDVPASNGGSVVTGYTLYWNLGSLSEASQVLTTTSGSITFHTAEGLTPGTSYIFKALATNIINDGQATAAVTLIAAEAPGAPTDI